MNLNQEQQEAVNARQGYWAVQAGPGSGKTQVILERYKELIKEGINPKDVLCLTFTSKTASEMRSRAGAEAVRGHDQHERPSGFMTFHSLALKFSILERDNFPFPLAEEPLAPPQMTIKILSGLARRYGLPNFRPLASWISEQKRNGICPQGVLALTADRIRLKEAYQTYQNLLQSEGVLDFDDLILEMRDILQGHGDILDWNFHFVQCDEYQDCDRLQVEVLKLLSQKYGNLFVVGDYNQALYQFRGASPSLLLDFETMFPSGKTLFLGSNYRSSIEIVSLVRKLAPEQGALSDKFSSQNGHGSEPVISRYLSPCDEASAVVKNYLATKPESAAVLSRTNLGLRPFEDECARQGIKYFYLGESGFWGQREVRNVLAFAQCAIRPHLGAVTAAIRAPYAPVRYIKKTETIRRLKESVDLKTGVYEALLELWPDNEKQDIQMNGLVNYLHSLRGYADSPANTAIASILQDLRAEEYHEENMIEEADNNPLDNLRELVKIARGFFTLREFLEYSRKITYASRRKTGLALGTIHSAKGLQWDAVYATGIQEGMIPHERATNLDEEARILFVAVSRPKTRLNISFSGTPSRFLEKILKC
jgi:DNA helicase-2/ATP-dependent DNA helicase PcrA